MYMNRITLMIIALFAILTIGCGEAARVVDCIDGCSSPVGPQGPVGDTGPKGDTGDKGDTGSDGSNGQDGIDGVNGDDGADALYRAIGSMAFYEENTKYTGESENQLTCMLGESSDLGKVVLRLRSKSGGLFEFEKAGGSKEMFMLPAGLEILIITKYTSGTFKTIGSSGQQTKACSVPNN